MFRKKRFVAVFFFFFFILVGIASAFGGLGLINEYEDNCSFKVMGPPPYSLKCGEFTCENESHETVHCYIASDELNGEIAMVCRCPNWHTSGGNHDGCTAWIIDGVEIDCQSVGSGCVGRDPLGTWGCYKKEGDEFPDGVWLYPCKCAQKTAPPK